MKFGIFAAFSVLAMVVTGCSAVRVIDHNGGQNYYDGAFEFATMDGKINTYIAGAPFQNPGPNFAKSVTSMMYGSTFGRNVNYVPSKPNADKYGFHIVITFNAVDPISVEDICQDAAQVKYQPNRETTSMQGVFCQGGYPLSYASGYVGGLSGPSDPRLSQLVKEVALAMIPRYDDRNSSGGEGPLP